MKQLFSWVYLLIMILPLEKKSFVLRNYLERDLENLSFYWKHLQSDRPVHRLAGDFKKMTSDKLMAILIQQIFLSRKIFPTAAILITTLKILKCLKIRIIKMTVLKKSTRKEKSLSFHSSKKLTDVGDFNHPLN